VARPVAPRGRGRERVLGAALSLFAEHGVSGTSLHMIAEALGVTKAAVYHQFRTKEELVLAVLRPVGDEITAFMDAAEGCPDGPERLDAVVVGLVDLVSHHRRLTAVLRGDPAVGRLMRTHEPWRSLTPRVARALLGAAPDPARRVAVSMIGAGLMLSGVEPQLAGLDDATLHRELLRSARLLLGLPAPAGSA